jgi:hypothetical protein
LSAGLLFGIATALGWAGTSRLLPLDQQWQVYFQLIALALSIPMLYAVNMHLIRQIRSGKLKYGSVSRHVAVAWTAVGIGIYVLTFSLALAAWRLHAPRIVFMITPAVFALYGMGWLVSGFASQVRWMRWISASSFVASIGVSAAIGTSATYPICLGGLFLSAVLPGYLLIRNPLPPGGA